MRKAAQILAQNLFDYDAPHTAGQRILFRLLELFVVGFTISFCWEWAFYIDQRIETVLLPLGIAQYVDISFMFENGMALINAGGVTLLCLLGVLRIWPHLAYPAAVLLFHLQYVSRYCLGEISHGSNMVGISLVGFAVAMIFFDTEKLRKRFTFGYLYFFIGLGYTSAAFSKLIGTGPNWSDGRHLWMWIGERQVDTISKLGSFDPNLLQEFILADYRIGTAVLTFGLLTEFFGFLTWFRKTRYLILPAIIGMHIGIAIAMNIFFEAFTYQLVLLGLPWAAGIDRLLARYRGTTLARRWSVAGE